MIKKKVLKESGHIYLMLETNLSENMNFDRRCSKCKRMQIPECYKRHGRIFLTCNTCRFKAYQRTHPHNDIFDFHRRTIQIFSDTETDGEQESIQISNVALLSSSSSSAAAVNRDEPEPDPEPSPDGGIWMIVKRQTDDGGIWRFLN